MYFWVALKASVKSAKVLWQAREVCSNPGFLLELKKNYRPELQGNLMQKQYLLGPTTWKVFFYDKRNEIDEVNLTHAMTWKVTQRNVWKDIPNLQIKRLNSYTKSQHHAWMTINSKKKKNESVGE